MIFPLIHCANCAEWKKVYVSYHKDTICLSFFLYKFLHGFKSISSFAVVLKKNFLLSLVFLRAQQTKSHWEIINFSVLYCAFFVKRDQRTMTAWCMGIHSTNTLVERFDENKNFVTLKINEGTNKKIVCAKSVNIRVSVAGMGKCGNVRFVDG